LERKHGFTGSYSSLRRFLQQLDQTNHQVTSVIEFDPGDAAQIDFGQGPRIVDVFSGEEMKVPGLYCCILFQFWSLNIIKFPN